MKSRTMLSGIRLSTLDYLISVMDSPRSPLDFTIVLRFNQQLDFENLTKGALSARNLFPTTGSILKANYWAWDPSNTESIQVIDTSDSEVAIAGLVNTPFNLSRELPVKQLLIRTVGNNATTLVTKFHHAAADGTSASLWLNHQLGVAFGLEQTQKEPSHFQSLPVKQLSTFVRRSQFAYGTPSDQLWTLSSRRSGVRGWASINFESNGLRRACRKARGFTYNDLLTTCALEVFATWNREQGGEQAPKVGLWLPINIRRRNDEGFGNGTSRLRIYANYPQALSFTEKCREVRRQISWCVSHGEWVVPQLGAITILPRWTTVPILRRHLTRASIDMATGVFSHAERWNNHSQVFETLKSVECVGLLHPFQALAINGATHNGTTWLTFTYDSALLEPHHMKRLVDLYVEQIQTAAQTLQ